MWCAWPNAYDLERKSNPPTLEIVLNFKQHMNGMWIGSFPLEPHRSPKNIPAFCRRKCSVYCVLSESNACLTTKPNWSDIIRISHADSDSTVPWEEQKGLRLVAWSWIVLRLLIHSHHTQLASSLGYNG